MDKLVDKLFSFEGFIVLAMIIGMLPMVLAMFEESKEEKRVRLYKECMQVQRADEQVCKELIK